MNKHDNSTNIPISRKPALTSKPIRSFISLQELIQAQESNTTEVHNIKTDPITSNKSRYNQLTYNQSDSTHIL